ncbi:DUF1659 domain-containing protein [Neobacillus sp. D3-1R]|uniref:DUF1659 domain-containing protein n=1 Tax=Neobacillus sp. D3-1R TaxID=3445778 RepID=UPI003FA06B50
MAQAMLVESNLRLFFETGMNEKGEPIYKAKTFNNVKKEATVDQLFQVAQAIGTLSNDPINTVERSDRHDIMA